MDRIIVTQSRCKQCGLCVAHCKQEALSFSAVFTEAGYRPVQVDDAKCIKCGICYLVCPDRVFTIIGAPGGKASAKQSASA
ncbi:4Fe-4S binding protein [Desulfocurvus sp.]|jgi:2-oxoglutarate ferredoxin oxidoreductase subunit delta|uniref:4Fe-4S binding protein n=1 Tax=Desulfocurvus sp. TaxID=2871698 RepID=UPI0025C12273|nr:4Fe-4S binding protein [Desulfocurvus sp.]MCK9239301.1 4Fe-4S binding protein [Desulfocurvus sp.]